VVLVGTAHGNNLSNLMRNPVLRPLVGGVNAVTIGDAMAAKLNSSVKVRMRGRYSRWVQKGCAALLWIYKAAPVCTVMIV
jgi:stage III sporulation protein SpoIIIAA